MTKPTLLLPSQGPAPAHLFTRIRQSGAALCPGRPGLSPLPFRLCELELLDREQRAVERRIKAAKFPVLKSLETFEFPAIPSLNKRLVLELARSEYLDRRENVLALGNSGTGKTHSRSRWGSRPVSNYRVRFTTAAALVNDLLEARDDKRLLRLQKQLAKRSVDRRRARLRPVVEDHRRACSDLLPALRASVNARDLESPLQRDRDLRLRTPHRRAARPADPSRPHPRAQRRQLPPRTQQEGPPPRGLPGALTPPPHDGAGCAHGFPLRLSPPQGRSQTPLQQHNRAQTLRPAARWSILRHRGLILLRPEYHG